MQSGTPSAHFHQGDAGEPVHASSASPLTGFLALEGAGEGGFREALAKLMNLTSSCKASPYVSLHVVWPGSLLKSPARRCPKQEVITILRVFGWNY